MPCVENEPEDLACDCHHVFPGRADLPFRSACRNDACQRTNVLVARVAANKFCSRRSESDSSACDFFSSTMSTIFEAPALAIRSLNPSMETVTAYCAQFHWSRVMSILRGQYQADLVALIALRGGVRPIQARHGREKRPRASSFCFCLCTTNQEQDSLLKIVSLNSGNQID
jgi:hypothetical protein